MTVRLVARSRGSAEEVWSLLARPKRWREWAPHIRGAVGLGSPEVKAGRHGLVRVFGVVLLPARVDDVDRGRSWTWTVGPARLRHQVVGDGAGCTVTMVLDAPPPIELAYGPVVGVLNRRLARVAQAG